MELAGGPGESGWWPQAEGSSPGSALVPDKPAAGEPPAAEQLEPDRVLGKPVAVGRPAVGRLVPELGRSVAVPGRSPGPVPVLERPVVAGRSAFDWLVVDRSVLVGHPDAGW